MPWTITVRLWLKFQPSNRFMMEYCVSKISHRRYFLFYLQLYSKTFAVNLIRANQTVSLQRDNNIKVCINSSEISIIFSSAKTVSSISLILNIPGCFLYEGR